ncbi:MAG: glutamate--cysteine ligase [Burkholderiales bacterium]|jgi:glutamate--cysteine ligase|nr:glutamate--cysteine ligase [Burkholderiales bacterium]
MRDLFDTRIQRLTENSGVLRDVLIGLERESLRVTPDGKISDAPHPTALGSAFTHPSITTDFAEALLEFITPAVPSEEEALAQLAAIMRYAAHHIGDEMLWCASMPCAINDVESIRIADYGISNEGKFKHLYRVGLAYRYGKIMQMISGIHFNFSFGDTAWEIFRHIDGNTDSDITFRSARYLDMTRNALRSSFLIPYFFGASPAVDRSLFLCKKDTLPKFDDDTRYFPYATALRLSDIGYSNRKCSFYVSFDNLDKYLDGLYQATHRSCPAFEKYGINVDGEYRQINTNILQIENEFYTAIRPKQIPKDKSETRRSAFQKRGIRYVELRLLDVSPLSPFGIDLDTLRFIRAWLTTCFLLESPPMDEKERNLIDQNMLNVSVNGRSQEKLITSLRGETYTVEEALRPVLLAMEPVCALLGEPYQKALHKQREKLRDPDQTFSARVLTEMRDNIESHQNFALRHTRQYTRELRETPLSAEAEQSFSQAAKDSLAQQKNIEAADKLSFDDYLAHHEKMSR